VTAQVKEIMNMYEVDGFWFDIAIQHPEGCLCTHCKGYGKDGSRYI